MCLSGHGPHFARTAPLKRFAAPLELEMPTAPMTLLWHARYASDPAHAWFRGLVADAMGGSESLAKR